VTPILCLDDFEAAARRHLPVPIFEYIAGGAERDASRSANREAFARHAFVPRTLVDVSAPSSAVTLLSHEYSAPFGIAPMGLSALAAYRGDIVLAQVAARENVPMIMSGSSLIRLEEIPKVNPRAWFQIHAPGREQATDALVDRIRHAGYQTLVVTVDTPVAANRENNVRAGFNTPLRPSLRLAWQGITRPRWLIGTLMRTLLNHGMPHFENNSANRGAPLISRDVARDFSDRANLDWRRLQRIRQQWPGRLVVKGILDPRDAARAVDVGADAIIVSNHGGRQLDGAVAALGYLSRGAGGLPVSAGDDRWRCAQGNRCAEGTRVGRRIRLGRSTLPLCSFGRRGGGCRPRHQLAAGRSAARSGDARCNLTGRAHRFASSFNPPAPPSIRAGR
jgi:L-lactate dehydrogenase (cytochrome)